MCMQDLHAGNPGGASINEDWVEEGTGREGVSVMMFSTKNQRLGHSGKARGAAALLCLVAGACLTATAIAQQGSGQPAQESRSFNYDKRLGGGGSSGGAETTNNASRSVMVQQTTGDDGREYAIRIEDGKVVSVKIDGKEVPKDRIRHQDGKLEILDENGKVVHTATIAEVPSAPFAASKRRSQTEPQSRSFQLTIPNDGQVEAWTPPPVMLGITMSEPEQEVAEHLGLKSSEVIRIDSVIEGLPASAAGLQVHDVITAIDGKKPVSREMLLEHLRQKKAGDKVVLSIISKGKQRDVNVPLEAYDAGKLGQMTMTMQGDSPWQAMEPGALEELKGLFAERLGQAKPKIDEARRAIEEAINQLKEAGAEGAEKARDKAVELLAQALTKLESKTEDAVGQLQRFYGGSAGQPAQPTLPEGGEARPRVFITPVPSTPGGDQMERMTSVLERMEKRLAELEAKLEKRQREAEEKSKSSDR